jgi:hypothetical protein
MRLVDSNRQRNFVVGTRGSNAEESFDAVEIQGTSRLSPVVVTIVTWFLSPGFPTRKGERAKIQC